MAIALAALPATCAALLVASPQAEAVGPGPYGVPLTGDATMSVPDDFDSGDGHTIVSQMNMALHLELEPAPGNLTFLVDEGQSTATASGPYEEHVVTQVNADCTQDVASVGTFSGTSPPWTGANFEPSFGLDSAELYAFMDTTVSGTTTTTVSDDPDPGPPCGTPSQTSEPFEFATQKGGFCNFIDHSTQQQWIFDGANAPPRPCTGQLRSGEDALAVTLDAFDPAGHSVDGDIAVAQSLDVELTIANTGGVDLDNFQFAGDEPLEIAAQSIGGVEIVSGPTPAVDPGLTLGPGEEITYSYEIEPTSEGLAAAITQVTADDENDVELEGHRSLRMDIANGQEVSDALGNWIVLEAMDSLLLKSFRDWHQGMAERGERLRQRIAAVLSPGERTKWFGNPDGTFSFSPFTYAQSLLRGTAPEMVGASLPANKYQGYTVEKLNQAYNESFKDEASKGVSEWAQGWAHLGSSAKKGLQDSWGEAMLTSYYLFGTATPEERLQAEAYMFAAAEGSETSADNLVNTIAREVPNWQQNLTYLDEALDMAAADVILQSPDLQAQMAQEVEWRKNLIKLADTDPVGFQQAWAKRDAEIFNLGIPLVLDTLVGGGVVKVGGIAVKGTGAAVIRTGKAMGVLDESGNVVKGAKTALEIPEATPLHGMPLGDVAEFERKGGFLSNVEGATIVQSGDLGHVYELPNLGGVPETTLDAKAGILGELEGEFGSEFGSEIKLAEVLKESSPLRKEGAVGKLELFQENTGKPAMLDGGMPGDALSEPNVWTGPNPKKQPGFKDLSKPRQQAAIEEWEKAQESWAHFQNPDPTSKTARMKQCIGQRATVPLDLEPNPSGIQRFVTGEFEEVNVTQGGAQAKIFRVKYYEIEVVDTNTSQVLNSKVIVDSPVAVPMGPDADAVALAKVVGYNAEGKPILQALSREEREFLSQRYIDKNIKARKKPAGTPGAIPEAAEHGVTWGMDDASAQAAGKLIPSFGAVFMPEVPALAWLRRIAPFVKPANLTAEQMYKKMVQLVTSKGGFAQHAVVLTSDSRYLGEVLIESW